LHLLSIPEQALCLLQTQTLKPSSKYLAPLNYPEDLKQKTALKIVHMYHGTSPSRHKENLTLKPRRNKKLELIFMFLRKSERDPPKKIYGTNGLTVDLHGLFVWRGGSLSIFK
jgi:hypothetical protein